MVYDNIDIVILLNRHYDKRALMAKTDVSNTFRLIPIHASDRCLLVFTWPDDNDSLQFNIDCALPIRLSVSCQCFERFSSALQWIMMSRLGTIYNGPYFG